jgi:PadR family transcriptional regulator PadR
MSTQGAGERVELFHGTLDLLILCTLMFGTRKGQGIARDSADFARGIVSGTRKHCIPISAKWGSSSNNRKARFCSLTAGGREQIVNETTKWKRRHRPLGGS